jgi:hypothetical protein
MKGVLLRVLATAISAASAPPTSSTVAKEEVALRHVQELL